MNFSIVIPLYNESENISLLNEEIIETIKTLKKKINIILKFFMLTMVLLIILLKY